ncbi:MAG: TIR domain-containing protein [Sphingomonadaceae bacterium]|nr:TIR domain-containing protein [Sphingomonadaceae bacterium]
MAKNDEVMLFISHHSSTLETALEVETALAARGVSCWIAPRDVEPGEPFDNAVRAAIERSAAVLLLFCEKSDQSKHVKRELILGDSAGRPIIPLRLESIQPRELAYHLADSQWIDWIERREAVMDRVAAQARQYAGVPFSGGERPGRPIDAPAHEQKTAPTPVNPAPVGSISANKMLLGIAAAALLIAAIAVTWIVATGDRDDERDQPREIASTAAQPEGTGQPDEEAGAEEPDASSRSPDPAPITPQAPPASASPERTTPQGVSPSFNCANASTTREFLICGSSRLAAQDRELATLYRRARAMVRGTGQAPRLRADQRAWLDQVQRCTDENCVEILQRERIEYFRRELGR